MAVNDILRKISEESQNKREEILNEAKSERENIIKEAKEKAEGVFKEITLKAEKEAKLEQERLIILERLESQKETLSFKRKILDEVFKKVESCLSADREKFHLKKKVILPDKELEEAQDFSSYLKEIQPKLEIEVSKILWPE